MCWVLRVLAPRSALTKTEMLTVFFMVWLVGNLPTTGWAGYLLGDISAPAQLSSPENRVGEVIGPLLPDWLFLAPNPVVVGGVWAGLPDDVSIPWQPWVRPVFWWSVGSMSIVLAGFFGSFLPQRIASLEGLDESQKRAVLWARADDRPSFIRGLKDAAADVAYYRLVNTSAME